MNRPTARGEQTVTLAPDDVGPLLLDRFGLTWNGLSPFAERFAAYQSHGRRRQAPDRAAGIPHEVAVILAQPDVRVTHMYASASSGPVVFSACFSRRVPERAVVVLPDESDGYLVSGFDTGAEYTAWWIKALASPAHRCVPNYLPPPVSMETLACAFHLVDVYRGAKYRNALNYETGSPLRVTAADFAATMNRAMASRDVGWLLPAFLTVTPGVNRDRIAPRLEHLAGLGAAGFLRFDAHPHAREDALVFGEAGAGMGEEFTQGVSLAVGIEIRVNTRKGAAPWYQAFLVPTALANHVVEIQPSAPNGPLVANHQPMTGGQLFMKFSGVLKDALHPAAGEQAVARAMAATETRPIASAAPSAATARPQPPAVNEPPPQITCPDCGEKNPDTKKFCGECGGTLRAQPAAPRSKTPPAAAPTTTASCAQCGTPAKDPTTAFCVACGARMQPAPAEPVQRSEARSRAPVARAPSCPACNASLQPDLKFCTSCGTPVMQGQTRGAMHVPR